MLIDPITALSFSIYENKGVYALLLGSGISRPAQIPTGWEITLDLVRRVAAISNVEGQPDWAAWYRTQVGKELNYSEVLDALSSCPQERRSILHGYIEQSDDDLREGRKAPTRAHRAIAWLVKEGFVRVLLTTNSDRLTENALRDAGVEPSVIRSEDDINGAVPLIHSRCTVVKLHGDYHLDTRIKNTDEELAAYSPAVERPARPDFGRARANCDRLVVNAGEKMHRRAGVKLHYGRSQVSATPIAAFRFDQ